MFKPGDIVVVENETSKYFGKVGKITYVSGPTVNVAMGGRGRPPLLLATDVNFATPS